MQLELFDNRRDRLFDKLKITKSNLKKEDNFNYPKEKILKSISKTIKTDYKDSLIFDI